MKARWLLFALVLALLSVLGVGIAIVYLLGMNSAYERQNRRGQQP